jgi:hypothetical protein
MLTGVFLVIPCVIFTRVLWGLLLVIRTNPDVFIPLPAVALVSGFLVWTLVFAVFPRPLRSYILAHELTHALWGLMLGASVSKVRVRADHGSVVLSKTNFLITLSPYFFPLYTVMVIGVYYVLCFFYPVRQYVLPWLWLVGFTWGFHATFTVNALLQRQTDIQQQGRIFSYTVIYLANILGVCVWILFVTGARWRDLAVLTTQHAMLVFRHLSGMVRLLCGICGR